MTTTSTIRPSLLVIGSINMDLVLKVSRMPEAGESLIGQTYHLVPGGKGANQAVAAARLGAAVTFVGRLGADAEAAALKSNLVAEAIRTDFLVNDPESQTGLAVITIEESGQNSIVVIPGANMEIREEDIHAAFQARSYDAVLLQLEISSRIVSEACRLAKAARIPVVLDAGPAQDFPLEQLCGLAIISPNETETLALTGVKPQTIEDGERAAAILLARSKAQAAILKLGKNGALLCRAEGGSEHFPAYPIEAVDATAAGDAFTAALTVHYLQTGNLREAVVMGNAAGGLAAMKLGAQPSLPTAVEVGNFRAQWAAQGSHAV